MVAQNTGTAKPKSLSTAVAAGRYYLTVTGDGPGTATVTASHPGTAAPSQTIAYDAYDQAISVNDGATTVSETLSPSGRVIRRVVRDNNTQAVLEDTLVGYDGSGDSPAYSKAGSTVTTYLNVGGSLVTYVGTTASWALSNLHGDIVGTTDAVGTYTANPATDEFGVGSTPPSRLGWLGAEQRFRVGGATQLVRMGVRLYDPTLGRFASVDPVEGGSSNAYEYAKADPVNLIDLDGRRTCTRTRSCLLSTRSWTVGISKDGLSGFSGCGGFVIGLCWEHIGRQRKVIQLISDIGGGMRRETLLYYWRSVYIAAPGWAVPFTPFGRPWNRKYRYDPWTSEGSSVREYATGGGGGRARAV